MSQPTSPAKIWFTGDHDGHDEMTHDAKPGAKMDQVCNKGTALAGP